MIVNENVRVMYWSFDLASMSLYCQLSMLMLELSQKNRQLTGTRPTMIVLVMINKWRRSKNGKRSDSEIERYITFYSALAIDINSHKNYHIYSFGLFSFYIYFVFSFFFSNIAYFCSIPLYVKQNFLRHFDKIMTTRLLNTRIEWDHSVLPTKSSDILPPFES